MSTNPLILQEHKPRTAVALTPKQAEALREHYGRFLEIQPSWNGGWDIKAKQFVGTIVLDGLEIVIQPKAAVENLFFMLTYAYDMPTFWPENTAYDQADDLFEFIVSIFASQVEALVRQGLYRSYLDFEADQPYLRGRLQMEQQLTRQHAVTATFAQRVNEFTADILENRILRFTLGQLSRLTYRQPDLRLRLHRLTMAFAEARYVPITAVQCDEVLYNRLNEPYRSRIYLAKLLLQHLSLENKAGNTPFAAFLLDMNKVFERFIGRFLERTFAEKQSPFSVMISPNIWLGEQPKEKGIPDIVLTYQGQPCLILDTKYKLFSGKPNEADRNQMFIYCHTMKLQHAWLIYPGELLAAYQNSFPGMQLTSRGFALDGRLDEFVQRCDSFADNIVQFMTDVIEVDGPSEKYDEYMANHPETSVRL